VLMGKVSNKTNNMGKTQQTNSTNKTMMLMMPLMSLWIGFVMPAAMCIYWIANSVFSMARDYVLTVHYKKQLDIEDAERQNARNAREELLEKYPDRRIEIVDTLSISAPQAILVLKAYELYREGKSMEEVAQWVEANKMRAQAWFTVDDLKYLRRGGRISAVAAVAGTLLDLKPIITENREGKLVSTDKVRGRKSALRLIADRAAENIDDPANAMPVIMHADAPEDAQRLEKLLRERVPELPEIQTWYVGPVIGAHCGPGTVAICYFGKERPQ